MIQAAKPSHEWVKEWKNMNNQDAKASPEMSKKNKAKMMKSPQTQPPDIDLPDSALVPGTPITSAVNQFLEVRTLPFSTCHTPC